MNLGSFEKMTFIETSFMNFLMVQEKKKEHLFFWKTYFDYFKHVPNKSCYIWKFILFFSVSLFDKIKSYDPKNERIRFSEKGSRRIK